MKIRFGIYGIALVVLVATAYIDFLWRPRNDCPIADDIPPLLEIDAKLLKKTIQSARVPITEWASLGFLPRTAKFRWGDWNVHEDYVEIKGLDKVAAQVGIGSLSDNSSLLLALAQQIRRGRFVKTVRVSQYEFSPAGASAVAATVNDDSAYPNQVIFLEPLAGPSLWMTGNFSSRGLVKVTAGLLQRYGDLPVSCEKNLPLLPEVSTPHSEVFFRHPFNTVVIADHHRRPFGPGEKEKLVIGLAQSIAALANSRE